jgi:hypothetical protein
VGSRHFTALDTWEAEQYVTYQGSKFGERNFILQYFGNVSLNA